MIDMKLTPQQSPSATLLAESEANEGPAYPYGTTIELRGETLKRLAIGSGNLPQVGQKMRLAALVEVIEVSKEDQQIEAGYCVELQITAMELTSPDAPAPGEKDPAETLYG